MSRKKTTFGDAVEQHREAAGMTKRELSEKMGISRQTYDNYRTNRRRPMVDDFSRLVSALTLDDAIVVGLLKLSEAKTQ